MICGNAAMSENRTETSTLFLSVGATLITVWVLLDSRLNLSALLRHAADSSPRGEAVLAPGLRYGVSGTSNRGGRGNVVSVEQRQPRSGLVG